MISYIQSDYEILIQNSIVHPDITNPIQGSYIDVHMLKSYVYNILNDEPLFSGHDVLNSSIYAN